MKEHAPFFVAVTLGGLAIAAIVVVGGGIYMVHWLVSQPMALSNPVIAAALAVACVMLGLGAAAVLGMVDGWSDKWAAFGAAAGAAMGQEASESKGKHQLDASVTRLNNAKAGAAEAEAGEYTWPVSADTSGNGKWTGR